MRKLRIISLAVIFLGFTCGLIAIIFLVRQSRIASYQFPLQHKWTFEVDEQIRATPVVHNDQLLIRTNNKLYVIDGLTGSLMWSYTLSEDLHAALPLVQDNIVVLSHLNGTTALDLATGKLIWQVLDRDTRSDALPVASNEKVVVLSDAFILVRDINSGALLWKVDDRYARSNVFVTLDDKYLYVVFRDQIRAYDIETGELLWNNPTEEWSFRSRVSGLLDDNIIYLEPGEGGVAAYSLTEQRILWKRTDLSLSKYPMTKHKNILIIGSRGAVPLAIDAHTGETLWEAKSINNYDTYQTSLIFKDIVYIRSLFQKNIYALNIDDGREIGHLSLGIPDIVSANANYSLGPVQYGELIIFPVDNKLLAYGQ